MTITITTWNVNSVRTRLHQLLPWLESQKPDIVLLQELKCVDEAFPALEIESLGYNIATHGQKTYNGVAILSKYPLEDVTKNIPVYESSESVDERAISPRSDASSESEETFTEVAEFIQSRYIEAITTTPVGVFRVASVYVPNGQEVGSDKFHYKLGFLEQLGAHITALKVHGECLVVGGDYNVAPRDVDVYDPKSLYGTVCFHDEEQKRFRSITNADMLDAFRLIHTEDDGVCPYTWWDYRAGGFEHNKGMRIDHLLLSPQAADQLKDCVIERDMRGQEKPSDHVPVVATFG